MTKNRVRILCIVMVLTMAVLAAVAFADGTQESRELAAQSSNPIQIEQLEYERKVPSKLSLDMDDLQPFTQYYALKPAKYSGGYSWNEHDGTGLWEGITGARDKIVTVKNHSNCDVYFRTVIAYEVNPAVSKLIKINLNMDDYDWNQSADGTGLAVIEKYPLEYPCNSGEEGEQDYLIGGNFNIVVGTYNGKLKSGAISEPSLLQVAMVNDATEEQIAELGSTYEIFVWTQAVAADDGINPVQAIETKFNAVTADHLQMPIYKYKEKAQTSYASAVESGNTSAATDTDVDEKMINNNSN